MKQYESGVAEMLKTERFYPRLTYGQFVGDNIEILIDILGSADWDRLETVTQRFVRHYDQSDED